MFVLYKYILYKVFSCFREYQRFSGFSLEELGSSVYYDTNEIY